MASGSECPRRRQHGASRGHLVLHEEQGGPSGNSGQLPRAEESPHVPLPRPRRDQTRLGRALRPPPQQLGPQVAAPTLAPPSGESTGDRLPPCPAPASIVGKGHEHRRAIGRPPHRRGETGLGGQQVEQRPTPTVLDGVKDPEPGGTVLEGPDQGHSRRPGGGRHRGPRRRAQRREAARVHQGLARRATVVDPAFPLAGLALADGAPARPEEVDQRRQRRRPGSRAHVGRGGRVYQSSPTARAMASTGGRPPYHIPKARAACPTSILEPSWWASPSRLASRSSALGAGP